jgi:Icc-related predicted phosphoesterase
VLDEVKRPPFDPDSELLFETIHVGSKVLKEKIARIAPKLVITGHIHESYGKQTIGKTTYVNGSYLDENMKATHPPITVLL